MKKTVYNINIDNKDFIWWGHSFDNVQVNSDYKKHEHCV